MATTTLTCKATSGPLNFESIPILDFAKSQNISTKPEFLASLRHALVVVGFFYLTNPPVPRHVIRDYVEQSKALCNLPMEKKQSIAMINSKHFLGYSSIGSERTSQIIDQREIFDFLTPMPAPKPEDPVWMNVVGPNQWPEEKDAPGCRQAIETYLHAVGKLGRIMTTLVAEALDLPPEAFAKFFDEEKPRNKLSVVRYAVPDGGDEDADVQGVGPHKDGGFLTYLLQMTAHAGLEAQNKAGRWVPVPPVADSYVVNVGRSLESLTRGVCTATTHRVRLRPEHFGAGPAGRPLGARFSSPVFQTLRMDLTRAQLVSLALPRHVADMVRDETVKSDAESYFDTYFMDGPGIGTFLARLTSHPEVGRRWYPELCDKALEGQGGPSVGRRCCWHKTHQHLARSVNSTESARECLDLEDRGNFSRQSLLW